MTRPRSDWQSSKVERCLSTLVLFGDKLPRTHGAECLYKSCSLGKLCSIGLTCETPRAAWISLYGKNRFSHGFQRSRQNQKQQKCIQRIVKPSQALQWKDTLEKAHIYVSYIKRVCCRPPYGNYFAWSPWCSVNFWKSFLLVIASDTDLTSQSP